MKSAATLFPTQPRTDRTPPRPWVFINGVPEPRLQVVRYTAEAPLDVRTIVLDATPTAAQPTLREKWRHAHATIAQPMRLADDQVRWLVLGEGVIDGEAYASSSGSESRELVLRETWTDRLHRTLRQTWWARSDDALIAETGGRMQPGAAGNRSLRRYRFADRDVHVLQAEGQPWTLADALETLSAWAGLELSLALLPGELARAPLTQPVNLAAPMGDALQALCESYSLLVQREAMREGDRMIERRIVRPRSHGRMIALPPMQHDDTSGRRHVVASTGDEPVVAAQPYVAQAAGWRVESTFELMPGWHPSLEGEADATYDRTASSDFARYANVYRYWVLNEDGRFSDEPYNRGPAFDLAAFFGEAGLRPQALPLQPCLTLNDAGESRPAVVEVSVDAGDTWSQYPGQVRVTEHRAAVYLDDDTLPAGFLAAAKQGDARVRVTASLQSPQPIQVVCWRGNPFAGTRPAYVFHLDKTFSFERVAAESIHHADVTAGQLKARQNNPQEALQHWLVNRLRDPTIPGSSPATRSRLTLAGLWLTLQTGDRLRTTPAHLAVIHRMDVRFDHATTQLHLRT